MLCHTISHIWLNHSNNSQNKFHTRRCLFVPIRSTHPPAEERFAVRWGAFVPLGSFPCQKAAEWDSPVCAGWICFPFGGIHCWASESKAGPARASMSQHVPHTHLPWHLLKAKWKWIRTLFTHYIYIYIYRDIIEFLLIMSHLLLSASLKF